MPPDQTPTTNTAQVVTGLLTTSRRSQWFTMVIVVLVVLLAAIGSSIIDYTVHESGHKTVVGLQSVILGLQKEIVGLQAKAGEQTSAETQLRGVVANQACALNDAITTNAIIRQAILADINSGSSDSAIARVAKAQLHEVAVEIQNDKVVPKNCAALPPKNGDSP